MLVTLNPQTSFLMKSSPYNVSIQSNKQSNQEWSWTVRIQLGKDCDLPSAPPVRLNNRAISPGAGGSVVWLETCSRKDWQGKTQQAKVHQGSHTPTRQQRPTAGSLFFPRGAIFHAFHPACSDKPLTTVATVTPLWLQRRILLLLLLWWASWRRLIQTECSLWLIGSVEPLRTGCRSLFFSPHNRHIYFFFVMLHVKLLMEHCTH